MEFSVHGTRSGIAGAIQFAFTVSFHIIFPSFTIGIAAYLATLEVLWGWTGADRYKRLAAFWTKIFAVSFAMGVVSGIVLSYQIGTNWSRFSAVAGNVIGPLIGYEVLTAFFLEATFLSILLFGGDRVPRWLHVFSGIAVAVGTALSAFWILSANSWMQTPAGYTIKTASLYPRRLVRDHLQSELSVPARAHAQCVAPHRRLRRARGGRALSSGRPPRRGGAHHAADGDLPDRGAGAAAARARRSSRSQYARPSSRPRSPPSRPLGRHAAGSAFEIFAWPDEKTEIDLYAIAIPHASSLHPHASMERPVSWT